MNMSLNTQNITSPILEEIYKLAALAYKCEGNLYGSVVRNAIFLEKNNITSNKICIVFSRHEKRSEFTQCSRNIIFDNVEHGTYVSDCGYVEFELILTVKDEIVYDFNVDRIFYNPVDGCFCDNIEIHEDMTHGSCIIYKNHLSFLLNTNQHDNISDLVNDYRRDFINEFVKGGWKISTYNSEFEKVPLGLRINDYTIIFDRNNNDRHLSISSNDIGGILLNCCDASSKWSIIDSIVSDGIVNDNIAAVSDSIAVSDNISITNARTNTDTTVCNTNTNIINVRSGTTCISDFAKECLVISFAIRTMSVSINAVYKYYMYYVGHCGYYNTIIESKVSFISKVSKIIECEPVGCVFVGVQLNPKMKITIL